MQRTTRWVLAGLAALHLPVATAWADLPGEVERAISASQLDRAAMAISIVDADTGRVLISHRAQQQMIPASNMKLLSTGAALQVLGGEFRFTTRLLRDGDRLIVVGDGDPAFGDPELLKLMPRPDGTSTGIDVEEFLAYWVQPVAQSDLDSVRELVVDDRIFDRQLVHPAWPTDQLNQRYCAEVAGLNFHLNVLHYYPRPGTGGRPDISIYEPRAPWLTRWNKGTSRRGVNEQNNLWISRRADSNDMTFYGNVRDTYRTPLAVTVHDMPEFFGRLLQDRLRAAGVEVLAVRRMKPEEPEPRGDPIAPTVATPIRTIITRCNRDSQNLYAECLLKRAGAELTRRPGSWTNGSAILRHALHERLQSPPLTKQLIVSDGSGLSRENRVTAELITTWLVSFHKDEDLGPIFIESLASAGETGTMKQRFRNRDLSGMEIRAKSGYINHVSCLSGYVTAPDGRRRCFSILVNELTKPGSVRVAKRLQERIVAAVAADLAPSPVTLGGN